MEVGFVCDAPLPRAWTAFWDSWITGDERAGVTLEASCRARAAALAEGDKIGRPFGTLCLSLLEVFCGFGFLSLGLRLGPCREGLSACFGYASTIWTSEFQNMSPPMVFCPRHRQTVLLTGTETTEAERNGLGINKRRDY